MGNVRGESQKASRGFSDGCRANHTLTWCRASMYQRISSEESLLSNLSPCHLIPLVSDFFFSEFHKELLASKVITQWYSPEIATVLSWVLQSICREKKLHVRGIYDKKFVKTKTLFACCEATWYLICPRRKHCLHLWLSNAYQCLLWWWNLTHMQTGAQT